jgi:hypothetical protein
MRDLGDETRRLGNIYRHLWLLRSLASAAGMDLDAALAEGRLSPLEFSQMVTACRGGGCSKTCALWLTAQKNADQAAIPDFCASAEILRRLG